MTHVRHTHRPTPGRTPRFRGERGVAIVMTGLVLVPLMIFAAYGVDLAGFYSRVSQLQRAADAAALAGTVWMPDYTKAQQVAGTSLQKNGIVDGVDGMVVAYNQGSRQNSLGVVLTDTSVTTYFSSVIGHRQAIARSAEAQYNLPIPLGSPLNYFGGDASLTGVDPITTYSVTWPTDYTTRRPMRTACNIGTTSAQGLGRWAGSPSTYRSGEYDSRDPQCRWGSTGQSASNSSTVPPPDYAGGRAPNNGNGNNERCRVREDGTGTVFGYWDQNTWRPTWNNAPNNLPACSWTNFTTVAASILPDATTRVPSNQPCRIGWAASGTGGGWWNGSLYQATTPTSVVGGRNTNGNRLCEWAPEILATTVTPPNPIDANRSPGFWALIEGPGTSATQGDVFSTRCYINANCGSVDNAQYVPLSDVDRGFWYVVKVPPGLTGNIELSVFDAAFRSDGDLRSDTGDTEINGNNENFETEYRVFKQTNPLDFSARTQLWDRAANAQSEDNCRWALQQENDFDGQWKRLCTLSGVQPGDLYLLNVRTNEVGSDDSSGVNGYALQACANGSCSAGVQPALYAYSRMGMYNNSQATGGGTATFYLAEVGPQYAGKTLVIDLWDAGDADATTTLYPMMPSASAVKPVTPVPASACEWTSSPAPNAVQSNAVGGASGVRIEPTNAQPSDTSPDCGIQTTIGSTRQFNAEWLRIRVKVPSTYTCTEGINPEVSVDSCWWGIRYVFSGTIHDVTTWQARIEGNPVHLTQ